MTWRSALTLLCILLLATVFTAVVRTVLDSDEPDGLGPPSLRPDANSHADGDRPAPGVPGIGSEAPDEPPPAAGGEEPDGSATPDREAPADDISPPEKKRLPDGYYPKLTGSIVDVSTGEPIVGANLMYGPLPDSWGARSDGEGAFKLRVPARNLNPDRPFRLRVAAPGYEPFEIMPRDKEQSIELVPRTGPVVLGRILGRAEDKEGLPVRGVVGVVLGEETVRLHHLRVLADENGDFVLDAVRAGGCTIRALHGDVVHVIVPDGGEAHVVIRSAEPREKLEELSKTGFTDADRVRLASAERRLGELRNRLQAAREAGLSGEALESLLLQGQLAEEEVRQRKRQQAGVSLRAVQVTDIPGPDGVRLVVESTSIGTTERWWAVVAKGTATLPALYPAVWRLILKAESGAVGGNVELSKNATRLKFPSTAK